MSVHSGRVRLRWTTDIHLDHLGDTEKRAFGSVLSSDLSDTDLVVVTGDISTSRALVNDLATMTGRGSEPRLAFVLGNHDHYGGTIAQTRTTAACAHAEPGWLDQADGVQLDERTVLVGVGGWGDTRLGDPLTQVMMTDHFVIEDLAQAAADGGAIIGGRWGADRSSLYKILQALADADAKRLHEQLAATIGFGTSTTTRVVIATHVPPWPAANIAARRRADNETLPFYVSTATGRVIEKWADAHPEVRFAVLCGHIHAAGVTTPRPNVVCRTGYSQYGRPGICGTFDLDTEDLFTPTWPHHAVRVATGAECVGCGQMLYRRDDYVFCSAGCDQVRSDNDDG